MSVRCCIKPANGLTIGSNRSLRSLGRAKARPLTKRYTYKPERCWMLLKPELASEFLSKYKSILTHINSGQPPSDMKEYVAARSKLYDDSTSFNSALKKAEEIDFVEPLKSAVHGEFVYLKKYKNGYIFKKLDTGVFYQVTALTSPLENLVHEYSIIKTALLPFSNQFVCDGLISWANTLLGKNLAKEIREAYWEAKKAGNVVLHV